jgi:hypothetical protein
MMGANSISQISAVDRAIPARVIAELRAQIIEFQARPRSPGDGGTHWYPLDAPPRSLFEQAIQRLRRIVPRGHEFVGAEWWVRAATTDAGFPFHFDRDEGVRRAVVSPALASILYLSDAGGPTIIVDAAPTRVAAPRAAIAVHPRRGRFGMFPGALLHGVLPAPPARWPRVTMLVNWWRAVPRMEGAPLPRGCTPAFPGWRVDGTSATPPTAPLEPIDPARLMARAAWRELIAKQATYR